jgi:hypothetical protein
MSRRLSTGSTCEAEFVLAGLDSADFVTVQSLKIISSSTRIPEGERQALACRLPAINSTRRAADLRPPLAYQ